MNLGFSYSSLVLKYRYNSYAVNKIRISYDIYSYLISEVPTIELIRSEYTRYGLLELHLLDYDTFLE